MISDYMFDCGPSIGPLRVFSRSHLICNNPLQHMRPEDLLKFVERQNFPADELLSALLRRLRDFEGTQSETDVELIERLIMKGHGEGLAASPDPGLRAHLLWKAAELILGQYGVEHVNDLQAAN